MVPCARSLREQGEETENGQIVSGPFAIFGADGVMVSKNRRNEFSPVAPIARVVCPGPAEWKLR